MRKTIILSALAATAIVVAGVAGAATTPTNGPPGSPPPGMMGHRGPGMMGHWRGLPMMGGPFGCRDEMRKDNAKAGNSTVAKQPPELTRAALDQCFTKVFDEIDANHDGKVTQAEIDAWRQAQKAKREEAAFKRLDKNGDGAITKDEMFGRALARFDAIDTNHDGVISPDEMKAARAKWSQNRPGRQRGAPPAVGQPQGGNQ
jgi:Ca2+-binding EF-hand superfamily protein